MRSGTARNSLCLANEVISSFTLKLLTVNYANLLDKCFIKSSQISNTRLVKWNAHKGHGMILNVDGSSLGIPGVSGFGGLIQKDDVAWIHYFSCNIGFFEYPSHNFWQCIMD